MQSPQQKLSTLREETPTWCWIVIFLGLFILGCLGYVRLVEGKLENFKNYDHPVKPKIKVNDSNPIIGWTKDGREVRLMEIEQYLKETRKQIKGKASWYNYSLPGHPNYSKENYTAASRDYPRGTKLRVCTLVSEGVQNIRDKDSLHVIEKFHPKCVTVRVNDYGPEEKTGNVIDLSSAAFSQLAPLSKGIIEVEIIKL